MGGEQSSKGTLSLLTGACKHSLIGTSPLQVGVGEQCEQRAEPPSKHIKDNYIIISKICHLILEKKALFYFLKKPVFDKKNAFKRHHSVP